MKLYFRTKAFYRTTYAFSVRENGLKSTKGHTSPACRIWPTEYWSNQFSGKRIDLSGADKQSHAVRPA